MLYDNEDSVCGIVYKKRSVSSNTYAETPYFFQKNLQGDIIAITDNTGKEVARYSYDAWGVCTIIDDITSYGIATINPFRYRSYYFDRETGLYYLQSRYYDPTVGRFVNGDMPEISIMQQDVIGHNLFSYCNNNCVNNNDENGKFAARIVSAIIGGILSLLIEFIVTAGMYYYKRKTFNGYKVNKWGMIIAFVTGSISGALMVSSLKSGAQAAIGAIIGFVTAYIDEVKKAKKKKRKIDMTNPLINCIIGFISGLISGNGLGSKFKWTAAKWYVGGKSYFFPPLKIIATKDFAKGLANFIKSILFGQINKLL